MSPCAMQSFWDRLNHPYSTLWTFSGDRRGVSCHRLHRGMSAKRRAMMRSVRMPLQQTHAAAAGRLLSDATDWHSGGPLLSTLHTSFVHQGA